MIALNTSSTEETHLDARLAYWYPGIPSNFRKWTLEEKKQWADHIDRFQAEERLSLNSTETMELREIEKLVAKVTGSNETARRAKLRSYERRLIATASEERHR